MENRIKEFRKLRGLTQEELGSAINTTGGQISKLERGELVLDTNWMQRIATALQIHPADLITESAGDSSETLYNDEVFALAAERAENIIKRAGTSLPQHKKYMLAFSLYKHGMRELREEGQAILTLATCERYLHDLLAEAQ